MGLFLMPVGCLHNQGGGWVVQAPARLCEVTTQGWVGGQQPQVFANLGGIRQLVCDVCSLVFRAVACSAVGGFSTAFLVKKLTIPVLQLLIASSVRRYSILHIHDNLNS